MIVLSYWQAGRRLRLRCNDSISWLQWWPDQTWVWQLNDGRRFGGQLVDAKVLGRFLVLLQLQPDDRQSSRVVTVPLAADSLPADTHRHLRARLTLWVPEAADGVTEMLQNRFARVRVVMAKLSFKPNGG